MRAACLLVLLLMGLRRPAAPARGAGHPGRAGGAAGRVVRAGRADERDRLAFLLDRYGFLDRAALVDAELESADAREARVRTPVLLALLRPTRRRHADPVCTRALLEEAQAWVREWPADPCGLLTWRYAWSRRAEERRWPRALVAYRHDARRRIAAADAAAPRH
ncbi:MAG: hypothetical protein R3F43_12980 [bacterium]